jgi:DNA replication ATP-dependent helicase Dna2
MNVLNEFLSAIDIERVKQLKEFHEERQLPIDERELKGITMANLRVKFRYYDELPNKFCMKLVGQKSYIMAVEIFCENNISKFKEGSTVILSNGEFNFEMEVYEDNVNRFILKPNEFQVKNCIINRVVHPRNNWEINIKNLDITSNLLLTSAKILETNSEINSKIESLINGNSKNHLDNYNISIQQLNESQNKAYLQAINTSTFCLIQGPPGSGKTETIGYIAKYLVDSGLNILVTAPTHNAINNCLNSIADKIMDKSKVIKIGEKANNKEVERNQNITKKDRLSFSKYKAFSSYSKNGIAIGSTAYSLCWPASKRLDGWEFDVVIIDEASQLSIPLSIAAMCRSAKYIFVGDHKQLNPVMPKESGNEMFTESIFSRLAKLYNQDINLLTTSYRLNKSLLKIPNLLFYNNRLKSAPSTTVDTMDYKCLYHPNVLNNDSHILILHNKFDSKGRSPHEAKLTAELVVDLIQNGVDYKDIGIMSPYRAQVREIKKEIKNLIPNTTNKLFDSFFIDTVDSMQGQERSYIIYSLGNSHPLDSMNRLDFFYSPNRLNVAITRAKKKCIVIANYKVFDIDEDKLNSHKEYESIKESLEIFKQYYKESAKIQIFETDENKPW